MFAEAVFIPMQDNIVGTAFKAKDIKAREEDQGEEAGRIAYELDMKRLEDEEEEQEGLYVLQRFP